MEVCGDVCGVPCWCIGFFAHPGHMPMANLHSDQHNYLTREIHMLKETEL